MLMCQSHNQLVVPPHLEEYLSGLAAVRGRRGPVSGLGGYTGDIVEVLTADEWELLQGQVYSSKQGYVVLVLMQSLMQHTIQNIHRHRSIHLCMHAFTHF